MNHKMKIDVHHHVVPPAFTKIMQKHNIDKVAGAPLPNWTPERSIDVMDTFGTQTSILSLSCPGVYFGDTDEAIKLARDCNEYSATLVENYAGRFGLFAVLPMPFTEHACKEAIYALDVLKADGIVLMGSTEGKFLGDPDFDELMAELDKRNAVVFVHPNMHQSSEELGLQTPGFLLEFLCDTTRAAVNLVMTGTLERYPNINWILAHAGGFLPYIAWRLSLGNMIPEFHESAPQGIVSYLKRFYFDTALSPSPYAMAALQQLVDPSHILYGSDFPFAPKIATGLQNEALKNNDQLPPHVYEGIARSHALPLFPRLQQEGEKVGNIMAYEKIDLVGRIKQSAIKPVVALAEFARRR